MLRIHEPSYEIFSNPDKAHFPCTIWGSRLNVHAHNYCWIRKWEWCVSHITTYVNICYIVTKIKRPDTLCFTKVVRRACKAYLITGTCRIPECTTCIIIHKISVPIWALYGFWKLHTQNYDDTTVDGWRNICTCREKTFVVLAKATVYQKYEHVSYVAKIFIRQSRTVWWNTGAWHTKV